MTTYIVYANMPGYLPEGDYFTTTDLTEARQALADLIERDWDADTDGDPDADDLSPDARYLEAHTEVNLITPPDYVHVPGPTNTHLGRNYWIDVVAEGELGANDEEE